MNRVMVIGCCGAGKSTFAKKLGNITKLEVIHLDQHYWKPDWIETEPTEWTRIVNGLSNKSNWIMDGNYGSSMDIRLKRADTIVYLDYPIIKCLWRITKRILKYRGKVRPDMPDGCRERFDLEFYHYVATFNLVRRKKILSLLNSKKNEKRIFTFKDDRESEYFLKSLKLNPVEEGSFHS